jgi:SAM-dependent methyltransferase
MLDQARALDLLGDYRLVRENIPSEFVQGSFDVILAAFTFDNIPSDEAKLAALRGLRSVLGPDGCLLLIVSSPAIYVNEWASFSTRDFPENRNARDGDWVRIVMLDVPDRRPVNDVICTDDHYRRLFETGGFRVLDVQSPCNRQRGDAVGQRNDHGALDNLRVGAANRELWPHKLGRVRAGQVNETHAHYCESLRRSRGTSGD